ncbi:phosphotransferase [Paenibacillus arenilitoris]|uniref:Aminoglycoside phosphotransferase family protein n=1 Tax=Paenibacillus arenilitoris TaxID=2772299 RepID=A0A927CLW5_9BACL|nr:aminoglycoside phosphotransferase family protein [Paenibacillus arenilitoris]MBD2869820.1 aminoglycoside phosphotransferase family protein [Paenibacillus arenilitoris]
MDKINTVLIKSYGIHPSGVTPQQGGWAALAYRVQKGERAYFLKKYEKSRASTPKWTALIDRYAPILVWLDRNSGLNGKIPVPLLTVNGRYKCEDDEGIYMLYDYIEGTTIGADALTGLQAVRFAEIVAELHSFGDSFPLDTEAIKEDFRVPFLERLKDALRGNGATLPPAIRDRLLPFSSRLNALIADIERLSALLPDRSLPMVLCHTDLHHWNLMKAEDRLVLIDWEGLKLAPAEADMMFLTDKPYYESFMSAYLSVRPGYSANAEALSFYEGRRKLEDIWEFMEQLLFDRQDDRDREATLKLLAKELESLDD